MKIIIFESKSKAKEFVKKEFAPEGDDAENGGK